MQLNKEFIESLDVCEFTELLFFEEVFFTGILTTDKDSYPAVILWIEGDAVFLENPGQYKNVRDYAEKQGFSTLQV